MSYILHITIGYFVSVCVWKWSYKDSRIDSDPTSAITTKLWVLLLENSGSTKLVVGGFRSKLTFCVGFSQAHFGFGKSFEFRNEKCKGSRIGVKFFGLSV